LKALMRANFQLAFASQEVQTIVSNGRRRQKKHSRIRWYIIHGQRGQYDRNMNGEPPNKHVRTELDIRYRLVGQQCRIYFDTRRERVKPLIISTSGFDLSYTANIFILMILYDFCLLHSQFYYIIIYIRNVESCVQIADRCAHWKTVNVWKTLFCRRYDFKR
jgi:hypothetical protein